MLFTLKDEKPLLALTMIFIIFIQHDNESDNICTIWATYTCMLCTDGMVIFMQPCKLLSGYSILSYWLIVCAYMLCI